MASVAEPPEGKAEDRPYVSTVEDLEGLAVAPTDALQELRIRRVGSVGRSGRGVRGDGAQTGLRHLDRKFHI
jgi:hypothetical protein